jgi:uncharacterized membrane-anchored protein YjiN (DUF445 family)
VTSSTLSAYDQARLDTLVRARRRATALLGVVAAVFAATFSMGDATWVGFLRTTAEASLVGGLADWFAVTALFRHPLGLPIPHTAIIPSSKEGLGRNLGEFVRENFLAPEQLSERIEEAQLPLRLGQWLTQEGHADALAARAASLLGAVAEGLDAEAVEQELERFVIERIRSLPTAELLGRGLEAAIAEGHHRPLVSAAIEGIAAALDDNRPVLRRRIGEESPWWVPEAIDDAVFDRGYAILRHYLEDLAADPHHEIRQTFDRRLGDLALRLRTDPTLAEEVADRVERLTEDPELRTWARRTWSELARSVSEAAERPDSRLRIQMATAFEELGTRLVSDTDLRQRVEGWVRSFTPPLASLGRREIGDLIATTVDRWDPDDASRRLELWMGRDLQFVRINGTLVGGLAGLAIHSVVVLAGAG